MSYAVKEAFLTLQGEGVHAGRRAVFLRFAGCNLWSGLEKDRNQAICQFCDTDFVGMNGENGGRYSAMEISDLADSLWDKAPDNRFIVLTGGEPMLQVDQTLLDALHDKGFFIAMESNGTIAALSDIDWLCISPKAGSALIQKSGHELKLVWPQAGSDWQMMEKLAFDNFLIQPMDNDEHQDNIKECIIFVKANPRWRLSLQNHKILQLP